jgi:plasmid maintenance system antidote protein VapI
MGVCFVEDITMANLRGSEKLIRERFGEPAVISEDDVAKIMKIVDRDDIVLERWWWKGQPAIDALAGTISVPRQQVGEVINSLIDSKIQFEFRVFPKGIPYPEELIVSFRSGMK